MKLNWFIVIFWYVLFIVFLIIFVDISFCGFIIVLRIFKFVVSDFIIVVCVCKMFNEYLIL